MKRRDFLQTAGMAGASLLLGGCGRGGGVPLPSDRRNVLLLISDALRADHLGCYGALRSLTPNVDALSTRGVVFEDAFSSSPATGPSHATLLTGTYPTRHRVVLNEGRMRDDLVTLAQLLGRAGYETAAFVSNPVLCRRTGLGMDRGFGLFDDVMPSFDTTRGKPFRGAPETSAAAIEWLGRDRSRPFFLWVHLMEPHGPYEVPDPSLLSEIGDLAPLPGEPERLEVLEGNHGRGGLPRYQVLGSERAPARYRARYAARAGYVDRYVGRILDAVHRGGMDASTIIVFLSDHGELLGERGYYFQHSITLLKAVLRVPLVLSGPGVPEARRVGGAVGTVDVLPTLLDLLAVRWDAMDAQTEGQSLVPRLLGRAGDAERPRFAYCWFGRERAILLGDRKYTIGGEDGRPPRLTNLAEDPLDDIDLSPAEPLRAADLRSRLDRALARSPDLFVRGKGKRVELSTEDQERLRALGYAQ